MADLDTSNHTLNTSTSKQKFSFPKGDRFRNGHKILYEFPYSDAIVIMKFLAREQAEQLRSATAIKISA